ncbi:MAG: right-handed parallel beta-helix repeat-containing protein [Byssovorax sp.]
MNSPRLSLLPALLGALGATACGPAHVFQSPTAQQGRPAIFGAPEAAVAAVVQETIVPPDALPKEEPPPLDPHPVTFYKTQDSNDWVRHNFHVQAAYTRVILVGPKASAPAAISVAPLDLNAGPDNPPPAKVALAVTTTVETLAEAAALAAGGDLVAVMPGHYAGFTLGDKPDAGDDKFIHVKALGNPGEVVIDTPTPTDAKWMVVLHAAHHVILEGLALAGVSDPKAPPNGVKAGILITGDFPATSKLAHHIAFIGNYSHHHERWGLHSVDSHTVLLQDNLFAFSAAEHSAYVSDGSDDYVIRRNVFYGSNASGLQCNVDAVSSLERLKEHPLLADVGPYATTREYALKLLKAATDRFGQNAFPDGRGFNFIIEDNVMTENGKAGGGALNLAGVRESLIQNNLIYANHSSGIVEWDNGNPYDAPLVDPGPSSEEELTEALPLFGCFGNLIRNNTVFTKTKGRPALMVGNGSFGTRAYNNILINDIRPSIAFYPTGIWRFDGSHNVINTVSFEGTAQKLAGLATLLPGEGNGAIKVKWEDLEEEVMRANVEPWVLFEKGWWKLNKRRPLFRPKSTSETLAGTGDPRELPPKDIEGRVRQAADIGCYAASLPPKATP